MPDTTAFPYSSIVRLTVKQGSSYYEGSGVLISPDEVLTASHVTWASETGVSTDIQVSPGYASGVAPFGTVAGTATHYNTIDDSGGYLTLTGVQNDYAVIHLAAPVTGAAIMSVGADYTAGTLTVSGYPGLSGAQVDTSEYVSTYPSLSVLYGSSIGAGSSGGPVWSADAAGATTYGVVSAGTTGTGYFSKITAGKRATILQWMAQDDGLPTTAGYVDGTTGASGAAQLSVSSGGPNYLQWQYIWSSSDGVALSSAMPNVFLHGGTGQDSIQVTSGRNVLDGGTGSNFLTGGSGVDTFFTDARGTAVVWNTLRNFHTGDAATLWGFTKGISSYTWDATEGGAAGSTGATLRANIVGGHGRTGDGIDASITFAGLSVAQAKNLQITTGTAASGNYLYIFNPGV